MLVNLDGGQEKMSCFDDVMREDTIDAYYACSINWQNELYILGGARHKRQIIRLFDHRLKRVGDLSFDLRSGTCSMMQNTLYLCFDYDDSRRCRWSTGPLNQFSEVALSTHNHRFSQISCSNSKFCF